MTEERIVNFDAAVHVWKVKEIESVYDGDTFTCTIDVGIYGMELHHRKIRIWGIDTPEIRGGTDEEKAKAVDARDALGEVLFHEDHQVFLYFMGAYTFGRLVCKVFVQHKTKKHVLCIDKIMIDAGYAKPYKP